MEHKYVDVITLLTAPILLLRHEHARAVLEIIYHYSQDLCPFKTFFCSEILQIGPDIIY